MKVLATLLKNLLWLVLAAALCAALTVAAWWMGWPLATGLVILLGMIAVFMLFVVCRALWRWRNKQVFVQSVLQEQQSREESPLCVDTSALAQAWREGMAVFDASPLRTELNPRYSQPWFLTLDATGTSPLFRKFARCVPVQKADAAEQSPLTWNFLPSAVMLQVPEAGETEQGTWESMLVLLAAHARKMVMRGIVVLVSARDLRELPPDALRAKGQQLRQQVQQVMLTMSRHFPVYVCVQDLESLPGLAELSGRLPLSATDASLGALLDASRSVDEAAALAVDAARFRLRRAMDDAAAQDVRPQGDELLGLEALSALVSPLRMLLEQIFRSIPHQASPLLRGVFFCHTRTTSNDRPFLFESGPGTTRAASAAFEERPRYAAELFSHTIPQDDVPVRRIHSRFALYSGTKAACMAGWLLLLFFVCGSFAVNTVYQHHVLTGYAPKDEMATHSTAINTLYAQMTEIRYLDKALHSWPLPFMGQNMIGMVQNRLKDRFLRTAYSLLFIPMMDRIQTELLATDLTRNPEKQVELIRQLSWMCEAMANRMEEGTTTGMKMAFPLTQANESMWTPVSGELILEAMNWATDEAVLAQLASHMRHLLTKGLTRDGGEVLRALMHSTEPLVSGSRVCLSHYWPSLANSQDDVCVPGRYTQAGYTQLAETLEDILFVGGKSAELEQVIIRFGSTYNQEYWSAWYNFITKFNILWVNRLSGENLTAYGDLKSIADLPHVQVLQRLARELAPLQAHESDPPDWLANVTLLDTSVKLALGTDSGGQASTWDVVLSLVQSSSDTLTALRKNTKDTAHLRSTLQSIPQMRLFLDSVLALLHQSTNPAQALALASLHYGNGSTGDVSKSPFVEAEKQLQAALAPIPDNNANPARSLMIGLLDFTRQAIIVQAAREVQHQWEAEVLSSPTNIYRPTDIPAMFGEEGVVTTFLNTRLKPFVSRQGADFVPSVWQRTPFPLTRDFLAAISRGEAVAAAPARSSYPVLVRSQPTLVNIEARERPDTTSVTMQCTGKSTQLVNRNYPHDQTFEYEVEACGETTLRVDFPTVKLQRKYANFAEFLEDFQYGERRFTREDFPESADRLAAILVNDITVRMLPDNAADVLQRKNNSMPTLQDRITYVW